VSKEAKGSISVSIYITCPYCKEELDLFTDFEYDEYFRGWEWIRKFVNDNNDKPNEEAMCPNCCEEFVRGEE
jgi:hypothetical protein